MPRRRIVIDKRPIPWGIYKKKVLRRYLLTDTSWRPYWCPSCGQFLTKDEATYAHRIGPEMEIACKGNPRLLTEMDAEQLKLVLNLTPMQLMMFKGALMKEAKQ